MCAQAGGCSESCACSGLMSLEVREGTYKEQKISDASFPSVQFELKCIPFKKIETCECRLSRTKEQFLFTGTTDMIYVLLCL